MRSIDPTQKRMPKDYTCSRLEYFDELSQQRKGRARTDSVEKITLGKFQHPKACVFFMYKNEHKHHCME